MKTRTAACSASASIVAQGAPSTVARLGEPGWKPTAHVVAAPRSEPLSSTRVTSAPMRTTRASSEVRGDQAERAEVHGLEQARLAGAVAPHDREHLAAQRAVEPVVAAEVRGPDVLDAHRGRGLGRQADRHDQVPVVVGAARQQPRPQRRDQLQHDRVARDALDALAQERRVEADLERLAAEVAGQRLAALADLLGLRRDRQLAGRERQPQRRARRRAPRRGR